MRVPGADRLIDVGLRARWAAGWAVGAARALAVHAVTGPRIVRSEATEPGLDMGPADRPVPGDEGDVQRRADGHGPSFRRRYSIRVRGPRLGPPALMEALTRDPNAAAPFEIGRFVKTRGRLGEMEVGDEYLVWMPGPWNGPVRVAHRSPTSFRLATLDGHMEAGEIEFRAESDGDDLVFRIESAARSGTRPFRLAYGPLRLAREAQLHMWARFLRGVAHLAGGEPGPVEVVTRRFPEDRGGGEHPVTRRARRDLASLPGRRVNFPHASLERVPPGEGWVVDDHRVVLGREAPGPPEPDGVFAIARDLVRDYEFADPRLIRAVYDPEEPLERRNMLLRGRFLGLVWHLGVRVVWAGGGVTGRDGATLDTWGWGYRTLQGHLEMGQMDFRVTKRRDTGEVAFEIHAVSRRAPVRNPVVRLGFRIFGRGLQLRFARLAGARMRALVAARAAGRPARAAAPAPDMRPAPGAAAGG